MNKPQLRQWDCISDILRVAYSERERRRLSWRLRLGLGEPEELDDEEERELEEPERLEPEELEPLEEPELEPELLLEVELDLDLIDVNRKGGQQLEGLHMKSSEINGQTCCCCSR